MSAEFSSILPPVPSNSLMLQPAGLVMAFGPGVSMVHLVTAEANGTNKCESHHMGRLPGSESHFFIWICKLQAAEFLSSLRLEASLDTNEMKELFKAIDLDISEAHCASWRHPVQTCLNWKHDLGRELLAYYLQYFYKVYKYDVCLCMFDFCFWP